MQISEARDPGQELRIETRKLTDAGAMAYIEGTVTVDGEIVARGELAVVGQVANLRADC